MASFLSIVSPSTAAIRFTSRFPSCLNINFPLKLKHKRIRRPASIVYKASDFDYSCFLNGLPNIQFLCSEHHKEKYISIFFLYASLHFQLYSFIWKNPPPPLCYMLYMEKPQNQESASSANSLALRLSGCLMNHGYLKLFYIYQNFFFTLWTEYRKIFHGCICPYFIPCFTSTGWTMYPIHFHLL